MRGYDGVSRRSAETGKNLLITAEGGRRLPEYPPPGLTYGPWLPGLDAPGKSLRAGPPPPANVSIKRRVY
jgi:hypothetical protein